VRARWRAPSITTIIKQRELAAVKHRGSVNGWPAADTTGDGRPLLRPRDAEPFHLPSQGGALHPQAGGRPSAFASKAFHCGGLSCLRSSANGLPRAPPRLSLSPP